MLLVKLCFRQNKIFKIFKRNKVNYVQGQASHLSKAKREYFYWVDHRGQVFY